MMLEQPSLRPQSKASVGRAGYNRDYRVVHEDLVGLYLSAILHHRCREVQVLTFVSCSVAANNPSITVTFTSTSACTLQSASHCIESRGTKDERDVLLGHNHTAPMARLYSLCAKLLRHLIAGRGASRTMQVV